MRKEPAVVLLVEDEPAHAEIVKRNFASFQIPNKLVHVDNGQSALDYLYRQGEFFNPETSPRPQLVLLDLRLPKISGHEVLRKIKSDPELVSVPTVVLSTSEAEHDIRQAYQNHANSYLVKPFDFPKFAEMMRSLAEYWLVHNTGNV